MSRLIYKKSIVVDLISAYPPEIPSDISFFFPGVSSIAEYLSVEPFLYEDEVFKVYEIQKTLKILVKNIKLTGDLTNIPSLAVFNEFRSKEKLNLLIGIMYYAKKEFETIQSSVLAIFELAEILIGNRTDCTVIIASVNDFSKKMINTFKVHKDCEVSTFMNNKDMRIELYDRINCKYCNDIPCEAYVSSCCDTLYCEKCKKSVKNCFDCGIQNIQLVKEEFFTNFLKDVRYKCKCGEIFTCATIKNHSFNCELTVYKCKVEECKFEGSQAELVAHVIHKHFIDIESVQPGQRVPSDLKRECFKCMKYLDHGTSCSCGNPASFNEVLKVLALND